MDTKTIISTIVLFLWIIYKTIQSVKTVKSFSKTYRQARNSGLRSVFMRYDCDWFHTIGFPILLLCVVVCGLEYFQMIGEIIEMSVLLLLVWIFAAVDALEYIALLTKEGVYFYTSSKPQPFRAVLSETSKHIKLYVDGKDEDPFYVMNNSEKNRKRFGKILRGSNGETTS